MGKFLSIKSKVFVVIEDESNINDVLVDVLDIAKLINRAIEFKFNNSKYVAYQDETISELKQKVDTHSK